MPLFSPRTTIKSVKVFKHSSTTRLVSHEHIHCNQSKGRKKKYALPLRIFIFLQDAFENFALEMSIKETVIHTFWADEKKNGKKNRRGVCQTEREDEKKSDKVDAHWSKTQRGVWSFLFFPLFCETLMNEINRCFQAVIKFRCDFDGTSHMFSCLV